MTARVAAEAELERVNHSLEARVEERTAALTRVNAELEQARTKADTANRDKTRFLAAASHDLLQPLNAARLYTATLLERAGATGLDDLAQVDRGVAQRGRGDHVGAARHLPHRLRRDQAGARPPSRCPTCSRRSRSSSHRWRGRSRSTLTLAPSGAAALSDRTLVGRIVQNLVSNAIKYTRPGGRVLVGCRRRGGRLRIDVIDTGIGFNRDQHALIFAEFSRLDQGARMAQGLGLGLSIVKRLVTALGLTLELESIEGRGSRFSLLLPIASRRKSAVGAGRGRNASTTSPASASSASTTSAP